MLLLQLPYTTAWMNSLRCAFFSVHAWVSVWLCILVFTVDAHQVAPREAHVFFWEIKNYDTAKLISDVSSYMMMRPAWCACHVCIGAY